MNFRFLFPLLLPFLYRFLRVDPTGHPALARSAQPTTALLLEIPWVQRSELTNNYRVIRAMIFIYPPPYSLKFSKV